MNIIEHRNQLNKYGVTLHSRIVGILVDRIESAIERGDIRSQIVDEQDKFSVYDFIVVILGKKNPWQFFGDLKKADAILQNLEDCQFPGERQRRTPIADLVGLLYIAYQANCEFSQQLRIASAQHFAADRKIPIIELVQQPDKLQPIAPSDIPANLTGKTQDEIYQLASDYVQIRQVAAEQMPTLIEILDALADPAGVPAATNWFTARSWLAANGYTMAARQQRQFFQAIANTHRFLTITPPQQHNGINYYSNQHHILLRACATNVLRLGLKRTAKFI